MQKKRLAENGLLKKGGAVIRLYVLIAIRTKHILLKTAFFTNVLNALNNLRLELAQSLKIVDFHLQNGFLAIYLFTSMKKGLSSYQLAKYLSITQKSACFVLQRLREVLGNNGNNPFDGTTEIDEAYFGGKEENKHKHKKHTTTKQVVLGMVNRKSGEVKAIKVASAEKSILLPKIALNIKEKSTIITDSLQAYNNLNKHYKYHIIKHNAGEYVRKVEAFKVRTNAIEGYWSYVKRGIYGIYHWASKKHIQGYLNEFNFRYSKRKFTDFAKFENWFARCEGKKLVYANLIK